MIEYESCRYKRRRGKRHVLSSHNESRKDESPLLGHVCDVSRDITPLLTSVSSSEGPDVRCAIRIGDPGMVVGDATYSPGPTTLVGGSAVLFLVPVSVAQQTLVDSGAIPRGVSAPFAPLAPFVVLLWTMLPPIGEVVEAGIEHGARNVRGRRGIVKDAWLEAAEGVGAGEGS
jgi:hypothetical protein